MHTPPFLAYDVHPSDEHTFLCFFESFFPSVLLSSIEDESLFLFLGVGAPTVLAAPAAVAEAVDEEVSAVLLAVVRVSLHIPH